MILSYLLLFLLDVAFCANDDFTASLVPFSIELRSTTESVSSVKLSQELNLLTESHMYDFFSIQTDSLSNFLNLELSTTSGVLFSEVIPGVFSATVSFTGEISLVAQEGLKEVPDETELRNIQLQAFVGQAKLDFLNRLQLSATDDLLSSATYAKITFISNIPSANDKSKMNTILIACSSVFLAVALTFAAWSYYNIKVKAKNIGGKSKTQSWRKSKLRKIPDLELAQTESLSPSNPGTFPTFFDGAASINTFLKNDGKSIVTTNTIDINCNVDMLAWKHSKTAEAVPFETDITMIASNSPNKTMEVPKDLQFGPQKQSSSRGGTEKNYLSKASLSNHNETRFETHSRKYKEKKDQTSRRTYR